MNRNGEDPGLRPRRGRRRSRQRAEAERPLHVLVADDERLIREALVRVFELRGHTVRAVDDAYKALALLEEHRFDAALIDARMPGNGLRVLEALDRHPDFTGRAVLMTGAISTDPNPEIGPDVLLVRKPFNFGSMVRLVEEGGS